MIKVGDLRQRFVGKHLSVYSGWSGHHEYMKIEDIKKRGTSFDFIGKGTYCFCKVNYTIPVRGSVVKHLFNDGGKYEYVQEIDHCVITDKWEIK